MRIVFAGTPETALPVLNALVEGPHEVVAVLTRAPKPKGRSKRLVPSPVGARAEELGLKVLTPTTLRRVEERPDLAALQADVCIVVAYGLIIPADLLSVFKHGWINLHYSLLPRWRGASPVQHALLAGDEVTGATYFQIEEGLDTGPIYLQSTLETARHTADELLDLLSAQGVQMLPELLKGLEDGSLVPYEQASEGTSVAGMITKEQAQIDWNLPAREIDHRVRAYTSKPGAWSLAQSGTNQPVRLGIGPVLPLAQHELHPGEMAIEKKRVLVGTADADVELSWVVPAGKKPMRAADWGRGLREHTKLLGA